MLKTMTLSFMAVGVLISGCTTMPSGPNVMALPGIGLSFEQFQSDDVTCKHYASSQVGNDTTDEEDELQFRYDMAYIQCMYGKGHSVPISGAFSDVAPTGDTNVHSNIPQPPEGAPPAPPPGNMNPVPLK